MIIINEYLNIKINYTCITKKLYYFQKKYTINVCCKN